MANGKRELIEDISDIRRLAGLVEAPKKAASNPQDIEGKGDFGGIFGNPKGSDYQSKGGQVVDKGGKVNWGDPESSSDFFRADKMQQAQQAQQAAPKPAAPKPAAPKPAAPKPAAPKPNLSNVTPGSPADTMRQQYQGPGQGAGAFNDDGTIADPPAAAPAAPKTRGLGAAPKSLPPRPGAAEVNVPIIRPDSPRDTSTTGGYDLDDRSDPAPNSMTNQPAPGSGPIKWDGQTGSNWKTDKAPPRPAPFVEPKTFTPPDKKPAAPGAPYSPGGGAVDDKRTWLQRNLPNALGGLDAPAQITPPVTQLPSKEYRGQAGTSDGVARFRAPALDKALNNPNAPVGPNPDAFTTEPAKTPGPQSYFKPTSDEVDRKMASALGGSSSNWAPGSGVQLASKNNSIFPHEVIKELRDLAGLGEEEEDNSPIPFKYTPSPGLPKTAMTGEKDSNPFSKPGVQSGQNSNPFNKPGAGSRMEKESVKETDDMEEATDPRDSRPETYRPNNTGYAWDRLSTRSPSDDEDSKATRRGKQMGLKHSIRDALGKHGPKGKLPEDADMEEGNEFSGELAKAKASHRDEFEVDGKTYPVEEGIDVNPISDSLALMKRLAGLK